MKFKTKIIQLISINNHIVLQPSHQLNNPDAILIINANTAAL